MLYYKSLENVSAHFCEAWICTLDKSSEREAKKQPKFVLIHLLKIVTTASRKLAHSLELDDLAL